MIVTVPTATTFHVDVLIDVDVVGATAADIGGSGIRSAVAGLSATTTTTGTSATTPTTTAAPGRRAAAPTAAATASAATTAATASGSISVRGHGEAGHNHCGHRGREPFPE